MTIRICLTSYILAGCLSLSGCGDAKSKVNKSPPSPVDALNEMEPSITGADEAMPSSSERVDEEPAMAYVTSFDEPLSVPDRLNADLVSWSDETFDPVASKILHDAYDPDEVALELVKTLPASAVVIRAFDVYPDGRRLITVEKDGLGLYEMSDGSRVGELDWPAQIDGAKINMVRFCTKGDVLVASNEKIYRISGRDGSLIAECDGCGEIRQWRIALSDDAMIAINAEGKLFGGSQTLSQFSAYPLEENLLFGSAGLSVDGKRITVTVNHVPRVYTQGDNFEITGTDDLTGFPFRGPGSPWTSSGLNFDSWVNGIGMAYRATPADHPVSHTEFYNMLWRPFSVSSCYSEELGSDWLLVFGQRYHDGKEEIVLYDFDPSSRGHSVGHVVDFTQFEIRHSSDGGALAMKFDDGLRIYRRRVWQSPRPVFVRQHVATLVDDGKFDQIAKLHHIVSSQNRYAYGLTGGEFAAEITRSIGIRWQHLESQHPDSEKLAGLIDWYKQGSPLALTASGSRHYHAGWSARGKGTIDTVLPAGFQEFQQRLQLAATDLDQALTAEKPCLAAFETRINVGLESGEGLTGVDPICRRATELYPDNALVGYMTTFKLLPQWFGEPGDSVRLALAHAQVLSGNDSDLLYARLIGRITEYVEGTDVAGWQSYDAQKIKRGVDEWIRRELPVDDSLYLLHFQLHSRAKDQATADKLLKYLVDKSAAAPRIFNDGYFMRAKPGLYMGYLKLIGYL